MTVATPTRPRTSFPDALNALATHLTTRPHLHNPANIKPTSSRLDLQLHNDELHALVGWAASLGVDTATVHRFGQPDDDGVIRSGCTHLHVTGELPATAVPVEVWCAVEQLNAGDLANGSTVTNLGGLLAPLSVVR